MSHDSATQAGFADGVPFSFFCSLLREISKVKPHKVASRRGNSHQTYPARQIFRRWLIQLKRVYSPIPPGTAAVLFKLLFPEEDHHRKYDLQETRLAQSLGECFGLDTRQLLQWRAETASACLGEELRLLLEKVSPAGANQISPLTIAQVDEKMDQLASFSGYSSSLIRSKYPRARDFNRATVLQDLFRTLSPIDASFLTQIILKDLRPILYPLGQCHYTTALLDFNTESVKMLTKEHAMIDWDPTKWMLNAYRVTSTIEEAANRFELPESERGPNVPQLGVPVAIPKSEKGRSPRQALSYFQGSSRVWAEIKYDGERAQIHVQIQDNGTPKITIFSKSRRDSTLDRIAIHDVIYQALGLSKHGDNGGNCKVKSGVVLDAEMVACYGDQIDEFWRIRGLVERTAYGVRGARRTTDAVSDSQSSYSQSSMITDNSPDRHLGLVFFDVLVLNNASLLSVPYFQRREILESLVHLDPGKAMLAERHPISLHTDNVDLPQIAIDRIFSDVIARHEEGIVLKGEETMYHDFDIPWVKLKRDYIPGYGDTLDLVVVGGGWDKARARELRVGPDAITSLYIGALANAKEIKLEPSLLPHFEVYFTVSYGMTRSQLEEISFLVKNSETIPYNPKRDPQGLEYTFKLLSGLQPTVILKTPLLAEVVGAGFTKAPRSRNYELRFPRLTKIYRKGERDWKDAVNLQELHKIACEAIGRDNADKNARDVCNRLWGKAASPNAKSLLKRKAATELWEERLAALDGRRLGREKVISSTVGSSAPILRKNVACPPLATKMNMMTITSSSRLPSPGPSYGFPIQVLRLDPEHSLPEAPFPPFKDSNGDSRLPGMIFIQDSLVWFADRHISVSASLALKRAVPRQHRLHSVESLLLGCGWHTDSPGAMSVGRGVVFVDDKVGWRDTVLRLIEERRSKLSPNQPRKTIWIFDIHTWDFEREDVEGHAICRLD